MIALDLPHDPLISFKCRRCGRRLGDRFVREDLFDESEFKTRGTPAFLVVEDRLGSRKGNETVEWPGHQSEIGQSIGGSVLGIKKAIGPRVDAEGWMAEYGQQGVLVHTRCGCGEETTSPLALLVEEARRAADAHGKPPSVAI
jgi:hypothetical protein